MPGSFHNLLRPLIAREFVLLLALALLASGTWGFIELADEVQEGATQRFDEWAIRAMRQPDNPAVPLGPPWLAEVGRDLTALGGVAVLVLVTLAVVLFLLIHGKYSATALILAATVGGLTISTILKYSFSRPRPQVVPHLSVVITSSFPSGHSMLSAAVYLTLGTLLTRLVDDRASKIFFMSIAVLLTLLVGISRVYMGVHYPTDVLAGWAAGMVWAILCWLVALYLQRRGAVERHVDQ